MKRTALVVIVAALCFVPAAQAACTTIKSGLLLYSAGHYLAGQSLKVGFDAYGYNYQAHLFNGSLANAYLGRAPADGGIACPPYEGDDTAYLAVCPAAASQGYWPYRSVNLSMKWNDAWLSNQDCDGDGMLDRHYGFLSYVGSGAWLTNHQSDTVDGVHWTYFVKIVAVPASATKDEVSGIWYTADGSEIGYDIWGSFAIIQEVCNDPAAEPAVSCKYKSPTSPGFGPWGKL